MEIDDVMDEPPHQPHNIVVQVVGIMILAKVPFQAPAEYYLVQARESVPLYVMNQNISNQVIPAFGIRIIVQRMEPLSVMMMWIQALV